MKRLRNILIVAAVTAVLMEVTLRLVLDPKQAFPYVAVFPEASETHFKLAFLDIYRDKPLALGAYDPVLGWDYNKGNAGVRPPPKNPAPEPPAEIRRIAFIGDSFTHGNEVGPDEAFPHLISERCPDTESLNFGVGGYGIDQIALKFLEKGAAFNPAAVVIGVHPGDYERSMLSFYAYAKPVFRPAGDGRFTLENTPVPTPEEQLTSTRDVLDGRFFSWSVMRFIAAHLPGLKQVFQDRYIRRADAVNGHALDLILEEAAQLGAPVYAIVIPDGGFTHEDWRETYLSSPAYRRSLALLEARGIPTVNLVETFEARLSVEEIGRRYYFRRDNGMFGHLTPEGNRVAAEALSPLLCP